MQPVCAERRRSRVAPVPENGGRGARSTSARWIHLCTTNIVESAFNAVRLQTDASRRFKKVENAEAIIWKLLLVAEKSWRALNAPRLMRDVYDGKRFKDGVAVRTRIDPTRKAA